MNELQLAGNRFVYLTQVDTPPDNIEGMRIANPYTQDYWSRIISGNLSDMRAVIWVPPKATGQMPIPQYFLYWDDGTDLTDLDERITRNEYQSDDFDNAMLTATMAVACLENYDWGADTLVPVHLFPDNAMKQVFEPRILARFEKGEFIRSCPECGAPLNQIVVKILHTREKPYDPRA